MTKQMEKADQEMTNAFVKAITPEVMDTTDDMFLFKCSECGNVHFRHAGYVEMLLPYIRSDKEKKVDKTSYGVHVCTKCRQCFVWYNDRMRDVTKLIDLEAWQKAEADLHRATGPGGEC